MSRTNKITKNEFIGEAMNTTAGPYKYDDFDSNMKRIIKNVVSLINEKYGKQYNADTAHGIEDDGCPEYVYIGLNDKEGKEDWYFMINFKDAISCDDYYKFEQ